ncbi:MAG: glycosyltransferase family 2 protein [Chlorobi bacterium]|nr:glycosyltransferase family 2 protein [Chlorobiota bacterium]
MIKLSVVIITFNEEKNIDKCLLSVKDIADEIIVLDSFSTDKTEEICKSHNVKFFQHKFDGHIQQKNRVVTYAKNEFVLSLDADELLSDKLKKSISEIKETLKFDAYYFNRLNFYCGKEIRHSAWYPDKKIRLWNKNKAKWGGVNPHDTVILQEGAKMQYLKGDLLHYSFTSIEQHINQINKFSSIKAEAAFASGKKTNFLKIIFKPSIKFFIQYFIKLGFLDGFYGLVICKNSAHAEFLKQVKLYRLQKNAK